MRYKLIILSLLVICNGSTLQAQDPNFTQYFSSPLSLNPATAGFFDGNTRVAINQRQQWWNVGANYSTTSISADVKLLKEYLPYDDILALGISGMFDKSLGGALQSNYLSVTSAYHKSLADKGKHMLTVGFQATFANRFIDYNLLTFASQFNVDRFDRTLPSGISSGNSITKYIDINAGLLYAVHAERSNLYLGTSLYHANRPNETLFNESGYAVPYRKNIHTGGEIDMDGRSSLLFSGIYMSQGAISDKMIGAAYGLKTSGRFDQADGSKIYLGLWYRFGESYIPYIGVDYGDLSIGANYSMNTPTMSSYRPKTFEVSLIYKHRSNEPRSSLCPRF